MKSYAIITLRKFHGITATANAEPLRFHRHIAHSDYSAADIHGRSIVNTFVDHFSFRSQSVFEPLLFYVYKSPLPAAE